jgi:hypothetical protein
LKNSLGYYTTVSRLRRYGSNGFCVGNKVVFNESIFIVLLQMIHNEAYITAVSRENKLQSKIEGHVNSKSINQPGASSEAASCK